MKSFFLLFFLSLELLASSTTISVEATGSVTGFCQGGAFASFCVNDLEDRAERDAERNADFNCRIKNGALQLYSGYCSTFCNPSFIPDGTNAFVSCSSRCRFNCEIRQ